MSCAASAVLGRPVALRARRPHGPTSRRARSLRCDAGIKTGRAVWEAETDGETNRTTVANGEGFETEFMFDLGGETPAPVPGVRFDKDSEVSP